MEWKEQTVYRVREFNRFYLPALDLLGNHYLGSEYSATEARVLYEVLALDGCNAAHIARTMNIDKSYLSRILRSHERNGYLVRTPSPEDSRSWQLHLTEKGRTRTQDFIRKSNRQIGGILEGLSDADCRRLSDALDTVTEILTACVRREGESV